MRARLMHVAWGFLGTLLCVAMLGASWWTYQRYQEFVIMRTVIGQMLQQQRALSAEKP